MSNPYKQQARALRRQQRRHRKAILRRWRKCFFTWPLGHEYVNFGATEPDMRCVACDRPEHGYIDQRSMEMV